jgi:type II secretory pathway pseudopilin PulG
MTNARDEQGFVLVTAIAVLTVMIGLGFGLLLFADNQQRAAAREQSSESAFNLAEAALNAQVGDVSRLWPGDEEREYLLSCTAATSTATNGCPDPGSLSAGYPQGGPATCPAGTATEKWGSPLTNKWTTYVRDDAGESPYFNSATEQGQPTWDANKDGKVWVRSVGVAQCHVVTLTTLVSQQFIPTNFPHNAATGNWFDTSNNGNKVIVNTQGKEASQPGAVSMRCTEPHPTPCKNYDVAHGQVSPDTTNAPPSPSPTLSATQLEALKEQARWAGTYWPNKAGSCPPSLAAASGLPAYVEGPCELSYTTGVGNSAGAPGFLIIAHGTLELNGNAEFYGVIYALNPTNSSGKVVTVHGTSNVFGAIVVDGNGGIDFGSSAANLVYEPTAISLIKTYAGATPTRNSFRVLPINQ